MNKYETFRQGLLKKAESVSRWNGYVSTSSSALSVEFDISESHVREQILQFAAAYLISVTAWDGLRERSVEQWQDADADAFFFNKTDSGYIRIRLLIKGAELLAQLPKAHIGFVDAPH